MQQAHWQPDIIHAWLQRYSASRWTVPVSPGFVCVLGFTQTGLIPGISAAGATPGARRFTAVADAEFLVRGPQPQPVYPLPPLTQGASPVFITRAVVEALALPVYLFNAGLPVSPSVAAVDLGGQPANCLSGGQALPSVLVSHLFSQGLAWGEILARRHPFLVLSECVVGGTTTALAVLLGLGYPAQNRVNSSHPTCNHAQKLQVVQQGLARLSDITQQQPTPWQVVTAVGDPMQIVVAGMTLAASQRGGVLLAGGTQMLAVYALAKALAQTEGLPWHPDQILVGTTRWVVADPTGDTLGLAEIVDAPLLASQLSFATSCYPQLRAYEQGFVKEGVGAGGAALVAHLQAGWQQPQLLAEIEAVVAASAALQQGSHPQI